MLNTSVIPVTLEPPNGRGCGKREEGKPYICVGVSSVGFPIEHFIPDPLIPWTRWKRGMELFRVRSQPEINHVAIYVSRRDYVSWWSFMREGALFGFSRRAADNFPFEQLTPGESKIFIIHPRGIPKYEYTLFPESIGSPHNKRLHYCKWAPPKQPGPDPIYKSELERLAANLHKNNLENYWQEQGTERGYHPCPPEPSRSCAFSGNNLAYLDHMVFDPESVTPDTMDLRKQCFMIKMPSFEFFVRQPATPFLAPGNPPEFEPEYDPACVLILPFSHLEFKGRIPDNIKDRAEKSNTPYFVLDH